jgi:F-type H+-transporting ATPase subunit b
MNRITALTISITTLVIFGNITAYAADGPLISLNNTDFVVSLAFLAFVLLIVYLKVPSKVLNMLDNRSESIKEEIDSANKILEEAKTLLAELEREHKNNIQKASKIISDAENEAKQIIIDAKKNVKIAIGRKINLAEDQIKASEKAFIKSVRDKAVDMSVVLAEEMVKAASTKETDDFTIESSLKTIKKSLT